MSRAPSHKKLVDAIIDGELAAKDLATRAAELGPSLSVQMMNVTKALNAARVAGRITMAEARKLYLEAYQNLSLLAFARVAQDVVDTAQATTDAVLQEMGKVEKLSDVAPIREADYIARELEKKSAAD